MQTVTVLLFSVITVATSFSYQGKTTLSFTDEGFVPYRDLFLQTLRQPETDREFYFGGRIFIHAQNGKEKDSLVRRYDLTVIDCIDRTDDWYLASVPLHVRRDAERMVSLFSHPAAEPDLFRRIQWKSAEETVDPYRRHQWYLRNTGQTGIVHDDARVLAALEYIAEHNGGTGENVRIGIIDNGFDLTHEDFSGKFLSGMDIANDDHIPEPFADNGHGTCVSGIAAAVVDNGIGITGVCPGCMIVPVKIAGDILSGADEIAAFNYLFDRGVDVISCSWGPPDNSGAVEMPGPLAEIIKTAAREGRDGRGVVILFAAGNGNESISDVETRDGYAASEHVIAVGASNGDGVRAAYSDFGADLDILAPSCDTDPDSFYDPFASDAARHGIWTTDVTGMYGYTTTDYEPLFCGTSASTPIVAGVVGLLFGVAPELTRTDVYDIITGTAEKISPVDAAYDPETGHSILYGYGRIDARRAVAAACDGDCSRPQAVDEDPAYTDIDLIPDSAIAEVPDVDYSSSIIYTSRDYGCTITVLEGD